MPHRTDTDTDTDTEETRNLTPRLRKALIAAIEQEMNEHDRSFGYELSAFNGGDAAEEIWIWEQGGESSWVARVLARTCDE